ncbi:MAG: shikimate dehydrogenase [Actinomycetia bacterium]|nr:shikimate dehydrogenase [Actinomycetes bacterium]
MTISAATRVAGVIGDPVRHSLSPVLHNVAYKELGLDWVYVAFEVPDGGARGALDAMRLLDLVGLSVTMPHKTAAAGACDELSTTASALRSVNTVSVGDHGRLIGDSTDGEGFLRSLREAGHDPARRLVVLLGAGGAARAVGRALGEVGARVVVCARKADAAERAALLAGGTTVPWEERAEAVGAAELVVNATPIGMVSFSDAIDLPFPLEVLHPGQVLVDLVYHPIETPLLSGARGQGADVVDGLGMLVHQAALQVEQWTGRPAPVAIMRAAAELALGRRTA